MFLGTDLDFEDDAIETIEDLITSLSHSKQGVKNTQGKKKAPPQPAMKNIMDKSAYLDKRIDWLKKKADELNIKSFQESEGSTPDRASSLQHAIDALGDANNNKNHIRDVVRPVKKREPHVAKGRVSFLRFLPVNVVGKFFVLYLGDHGRCQGLYFNLELFYSSRKFSG